MQILFLLLFVAIVPQLGCHSTSPPTRSASPEFDSTRSATASAGGGQPSRVKQTVSGFEGIVDSVTLSDDRNYLLLVRIVSARVLAGDGLSPEEGQHLSLRPLFAIDDRGDYDKRSARNARLRRTRDVVPGGVLHGQVAFSQQGGWWLLDVEDQ